MTGLLDESELRARVERLAALERRAGGEGERRAAELIVGELRSLGLEPRVEEERVVGSYTLPIGIAAAGGLIAALRGGRLGALAGALAALAAADDVRAGPRVVRRLLPKRTTRNVWVELGPPDAARHVVLFAHYDAAPSGLVFHPDLARWPLRRSPALLERANTTPPTMWAVVAGPALAALGARRLGGFLSGGYLAAMLDIGARPVVPAANDNASGVAALLSLAHSLVRDPVPARVTLLFPGAEESFMEGMVAWARRHFRRLPIDSTYMLCLDTVGSPELVLLEGEGMLGIRDYPRPFAGLVRECADELEVRLWAGLRFRNATDGLIALKAGYQTAVLGSVDEFKLPTNYHWPTDTADNVDYGTVADAARLCRRVVDRLAGGAPQARSQVTMPMKSSVQHQTPAGGA